VGSRWGRRPRVQRRRPGVPGGPGVASHSPPPKESSRRPPRNPIPPVPGLRPWMTRTAAHGTDSASRRNRWPAAQPIPSTRPPHRQDTLTDIAGPGHHRHKAGSAACPVVCCRSGAIRFVVGAVPGGRRKPLRAQTHSDCPRGRKRSVEPYPARGVMTGSTSPDSMALTCRGRSVSDEPGRAYKRPWSGASPDWAASHGHHARRLPFAGPATRRITLCPAVNPPT
jgi:hypothetical protein